MGRPLIVYLHGFRSSPASWKSRLLGDAMAARGLADRFVCPPLSPVPADAMAAVSAIVEAADGPGRWSGRRSAAITQITSPRNTA